MPFQAEENPLEVLAAGRIEDEELFFCIKRRKTSSKEGEESRRSPSSPTSTSTLTSSLGGGGGSSDTAGVASVSGDEWAAKLQPIPASLSSVGDWESMLSESAADPGRESFLHWFRADADEAAKLEGEGLRVSDPGFGLEPIGGIGGEAPHLSVVSPMILQPAISDAPLFFHQDAMEDKTHMFGSSLLINQQHQVFSAPKLSFFPLENPLVHQPEPNLDFGFDFFPCRNAMGFRPPAPSVFDQLFKAAEQIEAGDTISAHRILARLNQQLPTLSGKPLIRSAFFFKEALLQVTSTRGSHCWSSIASPLDVLLKLGAHKAFAEISPVLQFTNFTTIQSILEELTGANSIHIIDFDLGVGSHWSALIQELSQRRSATISAAPKLRITAFTSLASHHPLELHLIQENLTHFAANLNVPLELNFLAPESFDPLAILSSSSSSAENIAVSLPVSSFSYHPLAKTLLSLIKQLSPKIMISVDHGYNRSDLPFSQHFLHVFQSYSFLLESIEASGINPEIAEKIERYLLQPRIESSILGRYQAREKLLPWRMLLASAGFVPVKFSNFAETMAECLLKRAQVRGFRVSKNQSSLLLSWQQGDIASVSAWRC